MSRVTRTTIPNAPRPTAIPSKSGSDRPARLSSPSAATYSRPGDRGGQDPVAAARTVGSRGGRAGDGDVRQRAQVAQRPAPVLEPGGEGAVGHPGADRDRAAPPRR